MWYVIQTMSGKEHEVCLWINTFVDKSLFTRCFVPLYEDVWRKEGIGHISIKRLFTGYLFIETEEPEKIHEALRDISQMTVLLSADDKNEKIFIPLHREEEIFFDSILSDGIMKVSYVHLNKNGKINMVIGPLQSYTDRIVRVDVPHRRAIVDIPIMGESKRLKFGLWLDKDPKLAWIEEEKKNRQAIEDDTKEVVPDNPWDWKAWKKLNEERKKAVVNEDYFGHKVGGHVINTTGIYGDTPLEIVEVHPDKNSIMVLAPLFGNMIRVEMMIDEVEVLDD